MTVSSVSKLSLSLLLGLSPWIFVACDSDGRSSITGAATFNGEPIDQGAIIFMPTQGESFKASGRIQDGRYEIVAEKGASIGPHKVLLFWEKKTGATYVDRDSGDVYDRRAEGLPKIYQSEQTPLQVEITAGPNVHDFNLTAAE